MAERSRITRREMLAGAGKTAAVGAAAAAVGWIEIGNPGIAEASGQGEIGAAGGGRSAYEYVGEVDQDGDALRYFGYYTLIVGVGPAGLYGGPPHDESTARFTYYGTANLTARAARNNVFVIDAVGTIRSYYNPAGGADFANPASFHAGTPIAVDDVQFHDVLSSTAPGFGVPNVTAFLERTNAPTFHADGRSLRFGHVGMQVRSTASGLGQKLDPKPKGHLTLAGQATVTG
jgi:hypothetical protein